MAVIETRCVSEASFATKLASWPEYTEVYEGIGRFVHAPLSERVANQGASSCLIVWALN